MTKYGIILISKGYNMRKNKRYSIVIKTGVETRSLKKYSKEEIINLISKYNSYIKNATTTTTTTTASSSK